MYFFFHLNSLYLGAVLCWLAVLCGNITLGRSYIRFSLVRNDEMRCMTDVVVSIANQTTTTTPPSTAAAKKRKKKTRIFFFYISL